MTAALAPLDPLFDAAAGDALPLPPDLAALYGPLRFPPPRGRPWVYANFVSTLDGVVDLNEPGKTGGSEISGGNAADRFVMGLLRAAADAVVVGAGTFREVPRHQWTAEAIYPPMADAFRRLRAALGKPPLPLNVVVTASGDLDPTRPVFATPGLPALVVTTDRGAGRLRERAGARGLAPTTELIVAGEGDRLDAAAILDAVARAAPGPLVLTEGGPRLLADLLAARLLDELFLTVAPQVAGRADVERPGLVAGRRFAPDDPRWAALVSARRAGSHLFLRYAFSAGASG